LKLSKVSCQLFFPFHWITDFVARNILTSRGHCVLILVVKVRVQNTNSRHTHSLQISISTHIGYVLLMFRPILATWKCFQTLSAVWLAWNCFQTR